MSTVHLHIICWKPTDAQQTRLFSVKVSVVDFLLVGNTNMAAGIFLAASNKKVQFDEQFCHIQRSVVRTYQNVSLCSLLILISAVSLAVVSSLERCIHAKYTCSSIEDLWIENKILYQEAQGIFFWINHIVKYSHYIIVTEQSPRKL